LNSDEFDVIQNSGLGAMCVWQFSVEFFKAKAKHTGPRLPILFYLLPVVYNRETCFLIHNRNFEGGLYKAISDDKTLSGGIHQRAELFYRKTWNSLNIGIASGLIEYDSESTELRPLRLTFPTSLVLDASNGAIVAASRRLGNWFGVLPIEEISLLLKVRF